jgi:hypothetical protein
MKLRGLGSVLRGPLVPWRADTPQKRIDFMKASVGRCTANVLDQGPSFKLHNAGCMQLHQCRVNFPDKIATLWR